jgi:hypothetical protein
VTLNVIVEWLVHTLEVSVSKLGKEYGYPD